MREARRKVKNNVFESFLMFFTPSTRRIYPASLAIEYHDHDQGIGTESRGGNGVEDRFWH
jgi:hypothetical protein